MGWLWLMLALIVAAAAQDAGPQDCHVSERCKCSMDASWPYKEEYQAMSRIKRELSRVEAQTSSTDVTEVYVRMKALLAKVEQLEANIDKQPVAIILRDVQAVRKELDILSTTMTQLQEAGTSEAVVVELRARVGNLRRQEAKLWKTNVYAKKKELTTELTEARATLANCDMATGSYNTTYFRGDNMAVKLDEQDWCDKYELVGIRDAFTHRYMNQVGMWMKDPLPRTPENRTEIFYGPYANPRWFVRFANYTDFISAQRQANIRHLNVYGLGFVVYNGTIYYHYSNKINMFRVDSATSVSSVVFPAPLGQTYMGSGVVTYLDLKVDEKGLWAVYADAKNANKLVISKMNPHTMAMERTWQTNYYKTAACATFMICGKLYALDTCKARLSPGTHHKQYSFDTNTNVEGYESLFMTSKYGHIEEVTYNPRERMLFAIDNKHAVTYSLDWALKGGKPESTEIPTLEKGEP